MTETTEILIHSARIVAGERVVIVGLLIALIAMLSYQEDRKSARWLMLAIIMNMLQLIGDSEAFAYHYLNTDIPYGLAWICYFISYTFGYAIMIPFSMYVKSYIEEKTTINKWIFRIPILIEIIAISIMLSKILSGAAYRNVDGKISAVGGAPALATILSMFVIVYVFVAAMTKVKQIGFKASMLLGLFGLVPAAVVIINYDYSVMCGGMAVLVVFILLQGDTSVEKEKQKMELVELNARLKDANEEQTAQLEEITALNAQLEENQAQLEEAAAEQEAQLEEISALNSELEERQAQLEEAASEQEAQIEEITALNEELETARAAADAANNAKTAFLFNMSHDIRTPMNAIMGFRDLLEKHQEETEKRADYLRKIEESSHVLLSIINNVLEMARIEKGTIEMDESAWSAEQFNDTLYAIFQEMMLQKGITFTRQLDVQNQYVYCDPIKLREVFINILSNAYKYTNAGGSVNMHLEEIPSNRAGYAMYRTTITDTGIGMSEEFLPHIFEEFSRENTTTDNKIEGTGLGMPIVKRLVELMEGTIEVRSEKGVGSTFVVTIPHRIAEKQALTVQAGVEIDPKLFVGKRILLAEDNELNAEIAMEILGEVGFIVERAEDGVICCEKLSSAADNYYDLILMDIQMPNRNGYDAARIIRKMQDSAKANIPILAMTANAFEEDKHEAFRAGMNGHLAKPINVNELMKELAGMLG